MGYISLLIYLLTYLLWMYEMVKWTYSPWLDEVDPQPEYDGRQLSVSSRVARREGIGAVDERRPEHVRQVAAVAVPRRTGRRRRLGRAVAERVEERADRGRRRRSAVGGGSSPAAGGGGVGAGQLDGRCDVLAVTEELDGHVADAGTPARVRRTIPVRVVVPHHVVDFLPVKLEYVTYVRAHDASQPFFTHTLLNVLGYDISYTVSTLSNSTSMSVIVILGQKCTLAASRSATGESIWVRAASTIKERSHS